ncbi:uncharacterized protein LOC131656438 [Vicia villosa]|uniref:uncharacterized protein LOC131656438 n=1 Tax=Vicia villosa TaxID=3911 RepID=UPI00273A9866|nr:uncharacterized protein LOC131656438 [Vicia villosa]
MATTIVHDDCEVGFEEGMLWLPSYVLDEASIFRTRLLFYLINFFNIVPFLQLCIRNHHQNQKVLNQQKLHHHKSSGESESISASRFSISHQRPKLVNHGIGNGMRAIFLESRNGSCGTGVFLPQRADTKFQPRKRPACAPVLLPARVVEALNINVHALGVQISPPQAQKYKPKCREAYYKSSTEKKNDQKDASKQCSYISKSKCSSQEIFLPKEWTY